MTTFFFQTLYICNLADRNQNTTHHHHYTTDHNQVNFLDGQLYDDKYLFPLEKRAVENNFYCQQKAVLSK